MARALVVPGSEEGMAATLLHGAPFHHAVASSPHVASASGHSTQCASRTPSAATDVATVMSNLPTHAPPMAAPSSSQSPPPSPYANRPHYLHQQPQQPRYPSSSSSHVPALAGQADRTPSFAFTSSASYQQPLVPRSLRSPNPPPAAPQTTMAQTVSSESHALSLKVMRISAPSLHILDRPYHEDNRYRHVPASPSANAPPSLLQQQAELQRSPDGDDPLLHAFNKSLTASLRDDMLSNESALASLWYDNDPGGAGAAGPSTLRDWPFSTLLTLPSSFGTLYLGESFSAYLCVRNEARYPVRHPSLRIEMQVGDGGDPSTGRAATGSRTLLAEVVPEAGGLDEAEDGEPHNDDKLETTVRHEIKELGPHVLICTVSYKAPLDDGGQVVWVDQSFRKFYKFAVPASPLSVRTKTHEPCSAAEAMHPDHRVREAFLLEVQVQNTSPLPLVLESLDLRPEPGWQWKSIDRPGLSSPSTTTFSGGNGDGDGRTEAASTTITAANNGSGSTSTCINLWQGVNEPLLPDDVRQYLFQLMPTSDKPARPIVPMPMTPATGMPAAASSPKRRLLPGQGPRPTAHAAPLPNDLARAQHGDPQQHRQPRSSEPRVRTTAVSDAIGSLDIAWRMSQGEPGRLQTSQLIRRRTVVLPVLCRADAPDLQQQQQQQSSISAGDDDETELPSIPEAGGAPTTDDKQQSASTSNPNGLDAAFVPSSSTSSPSMEGLPPPIVEVDLSFASASVPSLIGSAKRYETVSLPLQLWVRDLSAFSVVAPAPASKAGSSARIAAAATTFSTPAPDSDDSDDDRPLSEIASPRHGGHRLPSMSSRRSSAVDVPTVPGAAATVQNTASPEVVGGSRTLYLAVQHLALPHLPHQAQENDVQSHASEEGNRSASQAAGAAGRPSEDGSLRSEPSSLLRSLTSPSSRRRPLVRRSLQQNLVANLTSSPLLRTGSLSMRRGGTADSHPDDSPQPRSNDPGPFSPPTPPPKGRLDGSVDRQLTDDATQRDELEGKGSSSDALFKTWPRPYLEPSSLLDLSTTLPDVEGKDFERLGSSLLTLAPVKIAFEAGAAVGQAEVEFELGYIALLSGMVRVGGLRVLLLGWQDEVESKTADEDGLVDGGGGEGGRGGGIKTEKARKVELRTPITLREWSVVTELFVR